MSILILVMTESVCILEEDNNRSEEEEEEAKVPTSIIVPIESVQEAKSVRDRIVAIVVVIHIQTTSSGI
jgi:hypothetical protein